MYKKTLIPALIFSIIESFIICYFLYHLSSPFLTVILACIPILVLWGYIESKSDEGNKFERFTWINSILLTTLFIFGGLVINDEIYKYERGKELAEMRNWSREQFVADSLQSIQDSLYVLHQSAIFFQRDGNKIMGDFLFYMSQKDYKLVCSRIEKETNGIISVNGVDFKIGNPSFYKNQLCQFTIKTAHRYELYDYDTEVFDRDYEYNKYARDQSAIYDYLSERYGKNFGNDGGIYSWPFLYKSIKVYKSDYDSNRRGAGTLIKFRLAIDILHPQLMKLLKNERDSIVKQINEEKEGIEQNIRRKKETFSSGL